MNYKKLAEFYDDFIYDIDYDKIINFYKKIFNQNQFSYRDILELGCGTGNVTSKLIGYNVYAMDYSEEMLSIARKKLGNKRNIRFLNMDIRNFNLNKKFDVIIASLDVINYIVDSKDLYSLFKNVKRHSHEESIFIFDINSHYKISEYIGNNTFTDENKDGLYIWQGNYDEETKINDYLLTFFIKDNQNKYDRFCEVHKERAYTVEEITKILISSGFKDIKVFDDFEFKEINKDSMRMTFVVK